MSKPVLEESEFWNVHALRSKDYLSVPTPDTLGALFTRKSDRRFIETIGDVKSLMVLDVGCGLGELSLLLAQRGGVVMGLDISDVMVARSTKRSRNTGIPAAFFRGDAQHLPFKDESLDMVVGMRAIHHFPDLRGFYYEVYRVLHPRGCAVFIEPQRRNPIVEFGRKVFRSEFRTVDEHPLVERDIDCARAIFNSVNRETYYLISPSAYLFRYVLRRDILFEAFYEVLQKFDARVSRIEALQPYFWQTIIVLRK